MAVAPAVGPSSDRSPTSGPVPDQNGPLQLSPDSPLPKVLILEDDANCGMIVAEIVRCEGAEPTVAATVEEARQIALKDEFDFYILDHKLPDGTGAAFYYFLIEHKDNVHAIMLTGLPEVSQAVALTRTGLMDYLTKPFSLVQLRACLTQAFARRARTKNSDEPFETSSPAMQQVLRKARQAANNISTVLLTGETGVGKDVLARAIHSMSRKEKSFPTFVSLNCATLPGDMFEAELFGAERGAYTGSVQQREGLAEAATNGTLFLDEIAEVPMHLQAKLLHLLENREYRRLGSTETRRFHGRILAATNQCLKTAATEGRFRSDLLYRLDVFSIHIPPLRERKEDIPNLCDTILGQLSEKLSRPKPQLKAEDLDALLVYAFPGNVRELKNLLERSLLNTPKDCVWLQVDGDTRHRLRQIQPIVVPVLAAPARSDLTPVEAQEYSLLRQALIAERGGIRRAAAKLSMSHQALLRRLQKWPELRQVRS